MRVIRGLGPYYVVDCCSRSSRAAAIAWLLLEPPAVVVARQDVVALWCEIAFLSLIGGSMYVRRQKIGYEASRSPERAAAREELERDKQRARMLDVVFPNVRIGKHVDATAPLAEWLRDAEAEHDPRFRIRRREGARLGKPPRHSIRSAAR